MFWKEGSTCQARTACHAWVCVHVRVCFCSGVRSTLTSHTHTHTNAYPDGVCPVLCSRWAAGCNLAPWVLWMTPWMRHTPLAASGRKRPYFGEREAVGTTSGQPSSHCARPCSHPMLRSPRSSRGIGRTHTFYCCCMQTSVKVCMLHFIFSIFLLIFITNHDTFTWDLRVFSKKKNVYAWNKKQYFAKWGHNNTFKSKGKREYFYDPIVRFFSCFKHIL